jgi:hypothetical protein
MEICMLKNRNLFDGQTPKRIRFVSSVSKFRSSAAFKLLITIVHSFWATARMPLT